jgi:hypothetical protein
MTHRVSARAIEENRGISKVSASRGVFLYGWPTPYACVAGLAMFSVSIVEHLRLNCGLLMQNYTVDAWAAERLAVAALRARMTILGLLATATAAARFALFRPAREYQIVAASSRLRHSWSMSQRWRTASKRESISHRRPSPECQP